MDPVAEVRQRYDFDVAHAASILMTASFLKGGERRVLCNLADMFVAEKKLDQQTVLVALDYFGESTRASVLEDELRGK